MRLFKMTFKEWYREYKKNSDEEIITSFVTEGYLE